MTVPVRGGAGSIVGGGRHGARDDRGGVWIVTGLVMGAIVYAGTVVMLVAGFTPVAPLVIVPPVLIALIGANSLLGGGRTRGRSTGGVGRGQVPLAPSGPDGPVAAGRPPEAPTGEPSEPR